MSDQRAQHLADLGALADTARHAYNAGCLEDALAAIEAALACPGARLRAADDGPTAELVRLWVTAMYVQTASGFGVQQAYLRARTGRYTRPPPLDDRTTPPGETAPPRASRPTPPETPSAKRAGPLGIRRGDDE